MSLLETSYELAPKGSYRQQWVQLFSAFNPFRDFFFSLYLRIAEAKRSGLGEVMQTGDRGLKQGCYPKEQRKMDPTTPPGVPLSTASPPPSLSSSLPGPPDAKTSLSSAPEIPSRLGINAFLYIFPVAGALTVH